MKNESPEEAIKFAKKYLEDLLSFFDLNVEVHATFDNELIELGVPSTQMNGFLIGHNGETLRAIQFIVSMALKTGDFEINRVNVDIADYKKNHQERLIEQTQEWINKVKASNQPIVLKPMNPADRRIVHQVSAENGISTHSEGDGLDRHIVLTP